MAKKIIPLSLIIILLMLLISPNSILLQAFFTRFLPANTINPVTVFIIAIFILGAMPLYLGRRERSSFGFSSRLSKRKVTAGSVISFAAIAGLEEPKRELEEIIQFMKNPDRFKKVGAKIPRGIILYGPPGTGKTLLARSLAQEAGVEFIAASGSEFVEKYVGMGASRVRDLFAKASHCKDGVILFIDEMDSLGRKREEGENHIEKDQTLNQLLVELDGFNPDINNIVVLGSTNRLDMLDPALLRPGRFDRHINIGYPTLKDRIEILRLHTRNKPVAQIDLENLAYQTSGMTGAELANICNEAAIIAARNNREEILQEDITNAIDRIVAGIENKSYRMQGKERERVVYHESGHAVVGYILGEEPVRRVSILPRGQALGFVIQSTDAEKKLYTKEEILNKIATCMGGRAAEEIIFHDHSSGASNDIQKATEMALQMVTELGMAKNLSNCSYILQKDPAFIYEEVENIVQYALQQAKQILGDNMPLFKAFAKELLEKESLNEPDIQQIIATYPPVKSEQKR
ncbi:MAG: AAA family ATPase [Bacillota bacterium]|nr:AAA family ATPase [Bacillota bacterium]